MTHETIYLQIEEPTIPGDMGYEGATWCKDQINETDIKYVLAAQLSASEERVRVLSEAIRKARPKMEEAFQTARKDGLIETIEERHAWSYIWTASQLLRQALKRDKP